MHRALFLLTQQPGFDSQHSRKKIDVAEIFGRHWLEGSGQRLENVDRTHLVLVSGNLVPKKYLGSSSCDSSLSK